MDANAVRLSIERGRDAALEPLYQRRDRLTKEKIEIQAELTDYTGRVRGNRLPPAEYTAICQKQREKKRRLMALELDMVRVTSEIRTISMACKAKQDELPPFVPGGDAADTPEIVANLHALAKKYASFASDTTRISSMRAMAAKFVEEIREIVKAGYAKERG